MREIFTEIFENQPLDPTEAARQAVRPRLRKRFYKQAELVDAQDGVGISLDGRPILTPRRRAFVAPTRTLAEAIAAEWEAQGETIDPRNMPLTRLANAVIDAVSEIPSPLRRRSQNILEVICFSTAPKRPPSSSTGNRKLGILCLPGRGETLVRTSSRRKVSCMWHSPLKP